MGFVEWWKTRGVTVERKRLAGWRRSWLEVAASPDMERIRRLQAELDAFGLPADDIEIEQEMLAALQEPVELQAAVARAGLPVLETGHRVVAGEVCHFSAPASMPDEPTQPAGRLLLTAGRAIFVGGASGLSAAWHTVTEALPAERDLVLVRVDRDAVHRFRCNSFGDALRAAFIARALVASRRPPRPGL
jgi:hypothetical protein